MSKLNQGLYYDGEPLDKLPIKIPKTKERLDILYSFWSGPILDSLDFPWIHGDAGRCFECLLSTWTQISPSSQDAWMQKGRDIHTNYWMDEATHNFIIRHKSHIKILQWYVIRTPQRWRAWAPRTCKHTVNDEHTGTRSWTPTQRSRACDREGMKGYELRKSKSCSPKGQEAPSCINTQVHLDSTQAKQHQLWNH